MQKGIQNEINFTRYFNNKTVDELSINAQNLLYNIYNNKITPNAKIQCWRSKYLEKADIKIRINGIIKGLSLKTGKACSMHQENKYKFYKFLTRIGVNNDIILMFDNFMIGKINNKKVNSKTYTKVKSQEISEINEIFNQYYIKTNMIIRFICQGNEIQLYGCDALIYGDVTSFLWATKDEILKYLSNYPVTNNEYVNSGRLCIKCYDRNLNNNTKRTTKEKDIQVKWVTIEEDLNQITMARKNKNVKNNI